LGLRINRAEGLTVAGPILDGVGPGSGAPFCV
jgi:hypothetical protein